MPSFKANELSDDGDHFGKIESFVPPQLKEGDRRSYKQIKSSFKQEQKIRDAQFRVSDLVAQGLSVEEEDRLRFKSAVEAAVAEQMAKISSEVKTKAYAEGFQKGREEGHAQEVSRLREGFEKLNQVVNSLINLSPGVYAAHEREIIQFLSQVAFVIGRMEARSNPEYLKKVVCDIVERSGATENIKIKLNSADFKLIDQIKQELNQSFGTIRGLSFEQDDSIESGGCRLETDFGEMRTHIEQQIESIKKEIEDKMPKVNHVSN